MTARRLRESGGIRRSICLLCLLGLGSGCGLAERSRTCGRVASALTVPEPTRTRTARPTELLGAAQEFDAAAQRLAAIGTLPAELAAVAKGAQRALVGQAAAVEAAARARKASRPDEYAGARLKAEETRRVLGDLKDRFDKLCAR